MTFRIGRPRQPERAAAPAFGFGPDNISGTTSTMSATENRCADQPFFDATVHHGQLYSRRGAVGSILGLEPIQAGPTV